MARRKKRSCATDRSAYRWLRADPCIDYPEPMPADREPIKSSRDVVKLLEETQDIGSGTESLWVIGLDTRNRPVMLSELSRGGRAAAQIDVTVLLQTVLLAGVANFVIAHNHPSGETRPSDDDVALTERIRKGAQLVGARLLDHVVVAYPDRYFSFLDAGLLGR